MKETLTQDYEKNRDLYGAFTGRIEQVVRSLLEIKHIESFAIETRTKSLTSFEGKISREDKADKYKFLSDITDLSGIRIIAFLQKDCDDICSLITDNFSIDRVNSIAKNEELAPDKFGYLSTHYIVSFTDARVALTDFAAYKDLKAEIQVRTVLQHAWAAIDWKFRYKGSSKGMPAPLQRRLYRISALLEAADNEFSGVNHELTELVQEYKFEMSEGRLDIDINSESVSTYIHENEIPKSIVRAATEAGISVLLNSSGEGASRLLDTIEISELSQISDIDKELRRFIEDYPNFWDDIVRELLKSQKKPRLIYSAVVRYALYAMCNDAKRKEITRRATLSPGYQIAISKATRPVEK